MAQKLKKKNVLSDKCFSHRQIFFWGATHTTRILSYNVFIQAIIGGVSTEF